MLFSRVAVVCRGVQHDFVPTTTCTSQFKPGIVVIQQDGRLGRDYAASQAVASVRVFLPHDGRHGHHESPSHASCYKLFC